MNVFQRIHEITELPTLPEVLSKVLSLISSDEGNAVSLARIIEQDPSLSAKLLKVANSSYYSTSNQRLSSLPMAIARIGFNEVRHIVTAISLIKQFSKQSNLLDYKMFWRHSLAAAYLMLTLNDTIPSHGAVEDKQTYFLAGLFHDVGILIFDQFFHKEFEEIISFAMNNEKSFLSAELDIAGKDSHQVVGSAVLEMWKIDASVISGVRFHHYGLDKVPHNHTRITRMMCLTEYILCNCGIGTFEGTINDLDKEVTESFTITSETVSTLFKAAEAQVEKADLIVAMGLGGSSGQLRSI